MTAYLGQTVFLTHFRCLFESSQEYQLDGVHCFINHSDKFSQMNFHDVKISAVRHREFKHLRFLLTSAQMAEG